MSKIIVILFLFIVKVQFAVTHKIELTVQHNSIMLSDSSTVSLYDFGLENDWVQINTGDSLWITIFNDEYINHNFIIDENSIALGVGSIDSLLFIGSAVGTYILKDSNYDYLGLSLAIVVQDPSRTCFNWTLRSLNDKQIDTLISDANFDKSNYYPNHFLINRKYPPNIDFDEGARIVGDVGDSIYLNIVNLGESVHSLHFHGYHAEVIYSSKFTNHKGRMKDTFPVYSGEGLILLIVPDKAGIYPVHDHNLVATTGDGAYGLGMFTTMMINE